MTKERRKLVLAIRKEGAKARRDCHSWDSNPYPPDNMDRQQWFRGYEEAERQNEADDELLRRQ